MRVLHGHAALEGGAGDGASAGAVAAGAPLDADDALAIEEVHLAYDDVKAVDPLQLGDAGSLAFEAAKKVRVPIFF